MCFVKYNYVARNLLTSSETLKTTCPSLFWGMISRLLFVLWYEMQHLLYIMKSKMAVAVVALGRFKLKLQPKQKTRCWQKILGLITVNGVNETETKGYQTSLKINLRALFQLKIY